MKIIAAFVGSLRKDSFNRATFEAYKELAKIDLRFEEISIRDFPLYDQDIDEKPQAVIESAQVIQKADGIIFFSPEYNYSVPGALKNAIDWLSRVETNPFNEKPTAIIGASPGQIGTARMQYQLRQIAVFLNMHVQNKPEVMINGALDKFKEGKLVDKGTLDFLKSHAQSFKEFIAKHG